MNIDNFPLDKLDNLTIKITTKRDNAISYTYINSRGFIVLEYYTKSSTVHINYTQFISIYEGKLSLRDEDKVMIQYIFNKYLKLQCNRVVSKVFTSAELTNMLNKY